VTLPDEYVVTLPGVVCSNIIVVGVCSGTTGGVM
jgi:hypothetical protein